MEEKTEAAAGGSRYRVMRETDERGGSSIAFEGDISAMLTAQLEGVLPPLLAKALEPVISLLVYAVGLALFCAFTPCGWLLCACYCCRRRRDTRKSE